MTWIISQALMNSLCSQEQEAASLVENSLDGEQSVPLSGNPTQQAYCAPDKMTVFSRLSRFGMTFKPLTENLGQELLMSYLADFPVKTSQQQGKEQELMVSDQECGERWQGLLAKFDPNTSLWKTVQCSLLEDLELSFQIFPKWGSMRNGVSFQRQTPGNRLRSRDRRQF